MASTLLIVQFVLAVIIIIAVLLQKTSGMGLGGYSGSNESMFGAKGPGGFLVKFTFIMGLVFVINTIALGYLYNQDTQTSVVDTISTPVPTVPAQNAAPTIPATPTK
jgi:preprotein translocase subunit SecG